MLLKRIEMQGFKSFADKTVLNFVEGATAVVGPNGSGKSNISDAIRWVIGEMSAKSLRGSNMQDVIFAGTETRKPVNYAEVSLVLDNSTKTFNIEFDETGSIGKRYRRQDEIGTPFCITFDFESVNDGKVTVRDRDTMAQERIDISELVSYIEEKMAF